MNELLLAIATFCQTPINSRMQQECVVRVLDCTVAAEVKDRNMSTAQHNMALLECLRQESKK